MTSGKKVLDVTTKDWTPEAIEELRQTLIAQGMKWRAKIQLKDGKIKWVYCREQDGSDISSLCDQMEAKILNTEKF